jgi:hypothetical protein
MWIPQLFAPREASVVHGDSLIPRQDGELVYVTLAIPRASYTEYSTILLGTRTPDGRNLAATQTPSPPPAAAVAIGGGSGSGGDSTTQTAFIVFGVLFALVSAALLLFLCCRKHRPRGPSGPKGDRGDDGRDGHNGRDGLPGQNGINGTNGVNGQNGQNGRGTCLSHELVS